MGGGVPHGGEYRRKLACRDHRSCEVEQVGGKGVVKGEPEKGCSGRTGSGKRAGNLLPIDEEGRGAASGKQGDSFAEERPGKEVVARGGEPDPEPDEVREAAKGCAPGRARAPPTPHRRSFDRREELAAAPSEAIGALGAEGEPRKPLLACVNREGLAEEGRGPRERRGEWHSRVPAARSVAQGWEA